MSILTFLLFTTIWITAAGISITFPEVSESQHTLAEDILKEGQSLTMAHHVANIGLKTTRYLLTDRSNIILSPQNIYSCLGILGLGAEGETKNEICRILGQGNDSRPIGEILRNTNEISHASALFLDLNCAVKDEFANAALRQYEASVVSFNVSDGEGARNSVNRWVSRHTNGTITELLQGSVDPNTRMIVVSALLFKGKWKHSFPPEATLPGKFAVDDKTSVEVQFMHLIATVPGVRTNHFDAVGLPYEGDNTILYLILPKIHGVPALKNLLSHFTPNSLKKLRTQCVNVETLITVPKMKIDGRFSLTDSLRKQGLESMFHPNKANFSGISEAPGLYVSQVYHSIHFEMNEAGTFASAATASVLTKSGRYVFQANRPFIFIIADKANLVLFMGAVVNPV